MEIINAKLNTHQLQEMKHYYGQILGLPIEKETPNSFQVTFGISSIEFNDRDVVGEPYYHFAFDIPCNQFSEAKEWIKSKTKLLTEDGADEIDFTLSFAKSFYFEDPAGNILEFIARLKTNPPSNQPFSIASIQKISEMSLVVEDKLPVAYQLSDYQIVSRDDSDMDAGNLAFMSDQKTKVFLLLTSPNRKWLFSEKVSKVFPIDISLDSGVVLGVNHEGQFYIHS